MRENVNKLIVSYKSVENSFLKSVFHQFCLQKVEADILPWCQLQLSWSETSDCFVSVYMWITEAHLGPVSGLCYHPVVQVPGLTLPPRPPLLWAMYFRITFRKTGLSSAEVNPVQSPLAQMMAEHSLVLVLLQLVAFRDTKEQQIHCYSHTNLLL